MDKLKMHSPDLTDENITKIRDLFPNCVSEAKDENGKLRLAVDFDQLRQELSDSIVEGPQERYRLDWPGKREALLTANAPIAKTLRPCRKESVDFDTTQNLFIEGDNLDALKLLQETYLGKVKMIYIDPPYNTGKDFIYKDKFAADKQDYLEDSGQIDEEGGKLVSNPESNGRYHSDWLSMMYPRLKLARNLLADNGVIFISIDDNEQSNLKRICDEVFGKKNFVTSYIWKARSGKDHTAKHVSINHENIVCYTRNIDILELAKDVRVTKGGKYSDKKGNYSREQIRQWGTNDRKIDRPTMFYPVLAPDGSEVFPIKQNGEEGRWRISQSRMEQLIEEKDVDFLYDKENKIWQLYAKKYDGKETKTAYNSILDIFGTSSNGTKELKSLFIEKIFDTTKPLDLIKHLIHLPTVGGGYHFNTNKLESDLILDFFAGSATTAHATMQLNAADGGNRKFIMVQLPEETDEKSEAFKAGYKNIAEISKERIRRAGAKILEGECHKDWNKDVGFRVLKIDASNMADVYYTPQATIQGELLAAVDNIKPGRDNPEDLLFQVLIDWGVDLTLPIRRETILINSEDKTVFFVNHAPYDLIACFDKGITEELVKELATHKPVRVVFRDNGFVSDAVKINVDQIFRQLSPATDVKSI